MEASRRRWVRRTCFGAGAVCALLALAPVPSFAQEDDTVPRPEVYQGRAESLVAVVEANRDAFLPGEDLFRFIALDGLGTYEPSVQTARAGIFYPGNGVVSGPNLACGTFGGEFPEEFQPIIATCLEYKFPLVAQADSFTNDSSATGSMAMGSPGDPVSASSASAKSHAAEDATTTDAVVQDMEVLGFPDAGSLVPPLADLDVDTAVFRVDNAASRTRQEILKGSLIVRSESTMSGIRMFGGLMQIASLKSVSSVIDDGHGKRTVKADLDISGVTVGGVPAKITDKGLVLATPSSAGPLDQQQQAQANEMMQELGLEARVLPYEADADRDGIGVASVGGLQIEYARDVAGLPSIPGPLGDLDPNGVYTGSFLLGPTSALGVAATFPVYEAPETPVDPGVIVPGTSGGTTGGDSGGEIILPDEVAAPDQPSSPDAPDSPEQRALRTHLLGTLFENRLAMVYLALVLTVFGLCLMPRLTLPARLPGPSS